MARTDYPLAEAMKHALKNKIILEVARRGSVLRVMIGIYRPESRTEVASRLEVSLRYASPAWQTLSPVAFKKVLLKAIEHRESCDYLYDDSMKMMYQLANHALENMDD